MRANGIKMGAKAKVVQINGTPLYTLESQLRNPVDEK